MTGGLDPSRDVDDGPEVVALPFLGLALMNADPDDERRARPKLVDASPACAPTAAFTGAHVWVNAAANESPACSRHVPGIRLDGVAYHRVRRTNNHADIASARRPTTRRTLHVGEQERHRPRGQAPTCGHTEQSFRSRPTAGWGSGMAVGPAGGPAPRLITFAPAMGSLIKKRRKRMRKKKHKKLLKKTRWQRRQQGK